MILCKQSSLKIYLSNRKQFTRIDGANSSIQNINIGAPQNSCLGPLLFFFYINDLPYSVKNAKVSMYAIDISLALQSEKVSQLTEALNDDLKNLHVWLKGNKLALNVARTQSLVISTRHKQAAMKEQAVTLAVDICDAAVEVAENIKYLGVYIDRHFKKSIAVLGRNYVLQAISTIRHIEVSIVDPHFRYCCIVWGVAGATVLIIYKSCRIVQLE